MSSVLILFALLCILTFQFPIVNILYSHPSNTVITSPIQQALDIENGHMQLCPLPFSSSAKWLWATNPNFISSLTFRSSFTLQQKGDVIVKMAADSYFSAYFNHLTTFISLTGGFNCNALGQTISPSLLKCGKNTVTITVNKSFSSTMVKGAVAFSVSQDKNPVYTTCPQGKFYETPTCSCRCYGRSC